MKEIKSWQAEDGSLHSDQLACARHEASLVLNGIQELKGAAAVAILKNPIAIFKALKPIADNWPEEVSAPPRSTESDLSDTARGLSG